MRPIDRYVYSPHAHKAAPRRALLLDITIATVTRPVIRPLSSCRLPSFCTQTERCVYMISHI